MALKSLITYFLILLISFFGNSSFAGEAINKALLESGIKNGDSLETKIDKALFLLNEKRYFYSESNPIPLEYKKTPYHLDSMRTPEQILEQKVGGFCGSSALAFASLLAASGVNQDDIQIVASVVNKDLSIICPMAGKPRIQNPKSGAPGHVFVALRFANDEWKIINSIDGSKNYERAPWFTPKEVQQKIKSGPLSIPQKAFAKLPTNTFGTGLTVFQSWSLSEIPLHTYEQRYDLIASGKIDNAPAVCRFTTPKESSH
jgi:hypothetical protein